MKHALLLMALLLAGTGALAETVALSGLLGSKALLVIDGGAPKLLAPGDSHLGIKLISTAGELAVIEIKGQRQTLRLGDVPVSVGAKTNGGGNKIVMQAGSGGHFMTLGSVNGQSVQFMVDTGATTVALGAEQADRAGISYKSGQRVQMSTANGVSQGWHILLHSVRIGDVEVFDVDAIVTPQAMPFALLGNSFLTRFQMRRENDQMTLERRY
jgi:aspartyl protease family protein